MNRKSFAIAALAVFVSATSSFASVSPQAASDHRIAGVSSSHDGALVAAAKDRMPRGGADNSDAYGWKNGANTG